MMRIAFIANIPCQSTGGVRRVIESLANGFRAKGHSVDLLFKQGPSTPVDFLVFPLKTLFRSVFSSWDIMIAHSSDGAFCAWASRFFRKMPKVIMHSHGWEERAFESWEKYGKEHGFAPSRKNQWMARWIRFPLLRLSLRHAMAVIFASEIDREWVARKYPEYFSKLHYIPNGFDPEIYHPYPKKKEGTGTDLLFVGNWTWKKGHLFLRSIVQRIIEKKANAKFAFAGLGISREKKDKLFGSGFPERIRFFEGLNPSEMAGLYRESDVVIHPSLFEGGIPSLTVLEAMACGTPVVAFAYDGLERFAENGKNAVLVPLGNAEALADRVIALLENLEDRSNLAQNAQEKVRTYPWAETVKNWEKIIR